MGEVRYWMYVGDNPPKTRGEYGEGVIGGRSYPPHEEIVAFDCLTGQDVPVGVVGDPDWVEVTKEEWERL